jgi:hypothetical protein
MAFIPESSVLNTINELKNLSHTITYKETIGASGGMAMGIVGGGTATYPVTVTTDMPNSTITVSGDTISGYYTNCFEDQISYRTVDDRFVTVNKWQDIVNAIVTETLSEIYYYKADTRREIIYTYIATASNGSTKTYTINVENDWTHGRNQLVKYTNLTRYQQKILVEWININTDKIPWVNQVMAAVDWENSNLNIWQ